jgi:hypothetical protein
LQGFVFAALAAFLRKQLCVLRKFPENEWPGFRIKSANFSDFERHYGYQFLAVIPDFRGAEAIMVSIQILRPRVRKLRQSGKRRTGPGGLRDSFATLRGSYLIRWDLLHENYLTAFRKSFLMPASSLKTKAWVSVNRSSMELFGNFSGRV